MAKAYTPGLRVSSRSVYRTRRALPTAGKVQVAMGDRVQGSTVVAYTQLEGDVTPMKVASLLACPPKDLPGLMLKKVGDSVKQDEPIARSKGVFGMMKTEVKAAATGTIESVSDSSGMVLLRGAPLPIQIMAHVPGRVVEVMANEGAVIETDAALVQGIFGVGGEARGPIMLACKAAEEELHEDLIRPEMKGCVVIGGARMTAASIAKAKSIGVAAIVSGGMDDADLRDFLGYDLGVAITGSEKCGLTLILTEGFGEIAMARRTFDLLASHKGREASVNGATQIRAGVMRPEIVIPLDAAAPGAAESAPDTGGELAPGVWVRIIRDPHFGLLGTVSALPSKPAMLDSGGKARVLEVALERGGTVTVPRANVERIET
ncbi:MAG: hypothetical protein K8R92_06330 [Planctomycetes bacterium]|nr:hypothetical protein [Planctomycetota bacterium]